MLLQVAARGPCLRRYRSAVRLSTACHRSTNPNQNALSLPLRAAVARRRHSLALSWNRSVLVILWPPWMTPAALWDDRYVAVHSGASLEAVGNHFGNGTRRPDGSGLPSRRSRGR